MSLHKYSFVKPKGTADVFQETHWDFKFSSVWTAACAIPDGKLPGSCAEEKFL